MSNRLETAGILPLVMEPIQAMKLGQAISSNQRQMEQTVALGEAFMALFRNIGALFSWTGRSLAYAQKMRVLSEMSDRQLSDIGVQRHQIATLCAQDRLGEVLDEVR
ncbi:MAG: DUF1127 domain-containing protein [Alphaproteobacteria bacterium]